MQEIHIIDTSIFCDLVNVPDKCTDSEATFQQFEALLNQQNTTLLLPAATVYETGNYIAQVAPGIGQNNASQRFNAFINGAFRESPPWILSPLPDSQIIIERLEQAPSPLISGLGMRALANIELYKGRCALHLSARVRIWSHDPSMAQYDRRPGL
ncbi:hypothetical protein [Hymenobacter cheonanensis]|uniref:hypothetical protein n=1 Tax=Hymenobacter sp. CA2-7 TaxID=3063993 RepID=UPI002712FC44|nr:hypothetical protein [Hymenobacter sp. CA2-7]MDO7884263.1 hypothetical protein [Hymenobacter sp. CA2-7]